MSETSSGDTDLSEDEAEWFAGVMWDSLPEDAKDRLRDVETDTEQEGKADE